MYVERIELFEDSDPPAWCVRVEKGFELTCDVEYSEIELGPRVGIVCGAFTLTQVEPPVAES